MITLDDIRVAAQRLKGVAVRTPLVRCPHQGDDRKLWFKPESLQPIGSFKLRGAYNKTAALTDEERRRGVIAYSSGNHAQGVAYAARAMGVKATIVIPRDAAPLKIKSTEALGATVILAEPGSKDRKVKAEKLQAEHGYAMVPPFNDELIIAGQGTIGLEIMEDMPDVDLVLVPISGGGLISGIATAIKGIRPEVKVVGVEPEFSCRARQTLDAGHIVELTAEQTKRTIADGLRAQALGDITYPHIKCYVDDVVTVNEDEIRQAVRLTAMNAKLVAEPSGAAPFAAFLFRQEKLPKSKKTVCVISGGNIAPDMLAEILR
jgi:threonine dehydratase